MPAIKTGGWLKAELTRRGMSQKELANKAGLSIPTIAKIISGERFGAPETWERITNALGGVLNVSVASEEFIEELTEDVFFFGGNSECNVFYVVDKGSVIFKDYLMPEDMADYYKDDLKEMNFLKVTLSEALELFKAQNKMI